MGIFKKRSEGSEKSRKKGSEPVEDGFEHASGASSLSAVLDAQTPHYDPDGEVIRPRGRSTRLFPE